MVKKPLPRISWDENFGPDDERRTSDLIVSTLFTSLQPPAAGEERLFFIVPTPTPYEKAEADFLAAAGSEESVSDVVHILELPRKGRCYAVAGEQAFRALIAPAFYLGPPELTLIAANSPLSLSTQRDEIVRLVLATLTDEAAPGASDTAGLHFDSGDLMEVF